MSTTRRESERRGGFFSRRVSARRDDQRHDANDLADTSCHESHARSTPQFFTVSRHVVPSRSAFRRFSSRARSRRASLLRRRDAKPIHRFSCSKISPPPVLSHENFRRVVRGSAWRAVSTRPLTRTCRGIARRRKRSPRRASASSATSTATPLMSIRCASSRDRSGRGA